MAGKKRENGLPGNGATQAQEPIGLDEVQGHLERLRDVSEVAAKLFVLLGEQITVVASTAPIQRGLETVGELKGRARAHRDGLATVFVPLQEQIERSKTSFWENNRDLVNATAMRYVEMKVKERVAVEVEKAIKLYRGRVENNRKKNQRLMAIMDVSRARTENALLRPNHLNERVAWIGSDRVVSLGEIVHADKPQVAILAKSLNLRQSEEDAQVIILNKILRHLGIQYSAVPSRTGILLMPSVTNLG